ncbi:MAG: SGNH/GDSL hydrolase family protein [Pseudanabaenales cyanobacterium]|nr:SGNH/GDSL hydrolase family protein [Pseudanabaenales cyanobacterium]
MVNTGNGKVNPRELRRMLVDPRVDAAELQRLLVIDERSRHCFDPIIRANPDTVDTTTMANEGEIGGINRLARIRRRLQYRLKVNNPLFSGQKIVSEGDSWFQFPLLLADVIDQLFNPFDWFDGYAVFSLGEAGDLLQNIINEDEITQAIEAEKPEVFLISGGGNDLVADGNLANFLNQFEPGLKAADYPKEEFDQFLEEIIQLYRGLFLHLLSRFPRLKIICHGYDYGIPNNGVSLGQPMATRGITDQGLQKEILRVIMDRFNEAQIRLVENVEFSGRVFHVDCRNVVGDDNWFDELHPNNTGFQAVGKLFDQKIREITGRR